MIRHGMWLQHCPYRTLQTRQMLQETSFQGLCERLETARHCKKRLVSDETYAMFNELTLASRALLPIRALFQTKCIPRCSLHPIAKCLHPRLEIYLLYAPTVKLN
jgi:hypothetical protein